MQYVLTEEEYKALGGKTNKDISKAELRGRRASHEIIYGATIAARIDRRQDTFELGKKSVMISLDWDKLDDEHKKFFQSLTIKS